MLAALILLCALNTFLAILGLIGTGAAVGAVERLTGSVDYLGQEVENLSDILPAHLAEVESSETRTNVG